MKDSPEKIQWHPAFAAAMGLEFKSDYEYVRIEQEHNLSKEPLRIDLLVLKVNNTERKFSNEIGHIMKTYNIIEYKSPKDGAVIEQKFPGIYYITGNTLFPVQIVVAKELDKQTHSSLRVLMDKADREDVETFLQNSVKTNEPWEREDIDAVLQASVSANKELYEAIRRDSGMCQALRELMKDEIEDAEKRAEKRGERRGERRGEKNGGIRKESIIVKNMYNNGITPEEISTMTNINLVRVKNIVYGKNFE
ncbi:MAG: hypothetical protein SPM04_06480 [Lachnospira sp.]|nr:hypothetical protein [Lachnospira sp.]